MIRKIFKFIFKSFIWFIGITILWVLIYKFVPVPYTSLMFIRVVEQKSNNQPAKLAHDWVSINRISPNLQKAVIISEDGNFLKHRGFDFKAIEKAYQGNQKGKKVRGGSTISQQTAKNVFLWPGRSYIRKGLEAYFTVLIELLWSKERIMEVYLNSIEMGNGVYGAQAAAQHWYKVNANQLNVNQAAGLAAILPNPRKFKASNSSAYINRRKTTIGKYLRNYGPLKY